MKRYIKPLLISIVSVIFTALASSIFVDTDSEWYISLVKPEIYPPPFVFSIAWLIVYGISITVLFRLLYAIKERKYIVLFSIQLILQVLWTIAFFMLNMPIISLIILIAIIIINIVILNILIVKDEPYGWLYFIVFIWFVFALMLNYYIVIIN